MSCNLTFLQPFYSYAPSTPCPYRYRTLKSTVMALTLGRAAKIPEIRLLGLLMLESSTFTWLIKYLNAWIMYHGFYDLHKYVTLIFYNSVQVYISLALDFVLTNNSYKKKSATKINSITNNQVKVVQNYIG